MEKAGCLAALLFNYAIRHKKHYMDRGLSQDKASPLFDALVFGKIKAALGGRVKIIISGGAPLSLHVENFLKVQPPSAPPPFLPVLQVCPSSPAFHNLPFLVPCPMRLPQPSWNHVINQQYGPLPFRGFGGDHNAAPGSLLSICLLCRRSPCVRLLCKAMASQRPWQVLPSPYPTPPAPMWGRHSQGSRCGWSRAWSSVTTRLPIRREAR